MRPSAFSVWVAYPQWFDNGADDGQGVGGRWLQDPGQHTDILTNATKWGGPEHFLNHANSSRGKSDACMQVGLISYLIFFMPYK